MKKEASKTTNSYDNSMGVVAVVFGILSIIFASVNGIILGVIALVFAVKQNNHYPNKWGKAGKILSIIGIILSIIVMIISVTYLKGMLGGVGQLPY